MKVAFTYYPLYVKWNHGAAVLSAHCRAAEIETAIIPMGLMWRKQLEEFNPDWTCFSFVTVHDYEMARPFIDTTTGRKLAGGVYARKGGEISGDFLHICRGEGETLPRFFLDGDDSLFTSNLVDEHLDIMPDYSGVSGNEFHRGSPYLQGKKIIPYSHSRGCPHKCTFCEVRNLPGGVRIKKTVRHDLNALSEEFVPDLFYFTDELLPYYKRRWRDQFKGNQHRFICMIRADIAPHHLEFLIRNGMYACAFGVETGDEQFRNGHLNKGVSDRDIFRTMGILRDSGIYYTPFFMEYAPGETAKMRTKTAKMRIALGGYPITAIYENLRVR